jgi:5-methylcytosine-specific restriction endonuclease McrA
MFLRRRVFRAYGHRCADCGRSDAPLQVHHRNSNPMDNRLANLIPLCRDCHRSATFPGV